MVLKFTAGVPTSFHFLATRSTQQSYAVRFIKMQVSFPVTGVFANSEVSKLRGRASPARYCADSCTSLRDLHGSCVLRPFNIFLESKDGSCFGLISFQLIIIGCFVNGLRTIRFQITHKFLKWYSLSFVLIHSTGLVPSLAWQSVSLSAFGTM